MDADGERRVKINALWASSHTYVLYSIVKQTLDKYQGKRTKTRPDGIVVLPVEKLAVSQKMARRLILLLSYNYTHMKDLLTFLIL